jgi:hypothetical protein
MSAASKVQWDFAGRLKDESFFSTLCNSISAQLVDAQSC